MGNIYNGNIKLNIFGTSHADSIGIAIDGFAPGIKIDNDLINNFLDQRKPNKELSNARWEEDNVRIIAGVYNGFSTGETIVILIENKNQDSSVYSNIARASHADYTNYIKSEGFADLRGAGARSGRLTAALCVAGALAYEVLSRKGIKIESEVISPTIQEVIKVKNKNDSIGGKIKCMAMNVEAGIGEPFFDSIESVLSHLLFSIPGCKALEFGDGAAFATSLGSSVLDELEIKDEKVVCSSNHNGGILGGVSNSLPIEVTVIFKPTPTIYQEEKAINLDTMQNEMYVPSGRHDACFALRTPIIVSSCMAIALLDLYTQRYGYMWMK